MLRVRSVLGKNGEPCSVAMATDHDDAFLVEMSPSEARQLAGDLVHHAACAEADATLQGFFQMLQFPESGLKYMLNEFKDYRARQQRPQKEAL